MISGKTSDDIDIRLLALKVNETDPTKGCAPGITGPRKLGFRACYNDPSTGTQKVYLNGQEVATANQCNSPWTWIDLEFDASAQAPISLHYGDAGRMRLQASYQGTAGSEDAGLTLQGNDQFTAKPVGFCVERPTPLTTPNDRSGYCTASDPADCAPFVAAGQEFDLRIRAVAWESDSDTNGFCTGNAITPNYREFGFDHLGSILVAPTSGQNGAPGHTRRDHVAGEAGQVVIRQSISEVGVFRFEVRHDYLGAGDVYGVSPPIGRFIPDHFAITPIQEAGCTNLAPPSAFTYSGLAGKKNGQPFNITASLSALNTAGAITRNYREKFMRLGSSSFSAAAIYPADEVYAGGELSDWSVTSFTMPISANHGEGALAATARFAYVELTTPVDIGIRLTATDADGATGQGTSGTVEQRLGRLFVPSAHSHLESLDLTLSAETQFYDGTRYTLNTIDGCTTVPAAAIGLTGTLIGRTELDSGQYMPTANSGQLPLPFTAPNLSGFIDATLQVPEWLRYDWDGNGAHDNTPTGRASWGLYRGNPNVIRLREVWN